MPCASHPPLRRSLTTASRRSQAALILFQLVPLSPRQRLRQFISGLERRDEGHPNGPANLTSNRQTITAEVAELLSPTNQPALSAVVIVIACCFGSRRGKWGPLLSFFSLLICGMAASAIASVMGGKGSPCSFRGEAQREKAFEKLKKNAAGKTCSSYAKICRSNNTATLFGEDQLAWHNVRSLERAKF